MRWDEGQSKTGGATRQGFEFSLLKVFFILTLGKGVVGLFCFEHGVKDTGDFVGGGNKGLRLTEAWFEPAVESAELSFGADIGCGSMDDSLSGAVVVVEAMAGDDFATGNLVVGRETQPRAKALAVVELMEITADLGQDGLGEGCADTGDFEQIYTGDAQ